MSRVFVRRVDPSPAVQSDPVWKLIYGIRHRVFIVEQGVAPEIEIEFEEAATHYLAELDGRAVGCGRWRATDKGHKVERVAVLGDVRGASVGKILMERILEDLAAIDARRIYLSSQTQAAPFYERLGFRPEGGIYEEAGIPHVLMVRA